MIFIALKSGLIGGFGLFIEKTIIMIDKIKAWLAATGISNLGWAAGFAGAIFMNWTFAAGVCAGIFVHLNYAAIKALVKKI